MGAVIRMGVVVGRGLGVCGFGGEVFSRSVVVGRSTPARGEVVLGEVVGHGAGCVDYTVWVLCGVLGGWMFGPEGKVRQCRGWLGIWLGLIEWLQKEVVCVFLCGTFREDFIVDIMLLLVQHINTVMFYPNFGLSGQLDITPFRRSAGHATSCHHTKNPNLQNCLHTLLEPENLQLI